MISTKTKKINEFSDDKTKEIEELNGVLSSESKLLESGTNSLNKSLANFPEQKQRLNYLEKMIQDDKKHFEGSEKNISEKIKGFLQKTQLERQKIDESFHMPSIDSVKDMEDTYFKLFNE